MSWFFPPPGSRNPATVYNLPPPWPIKFRMNCLILPPLLKTSTLININKDELSCHLYKRHLPEYIFKCTGHFVHLVNSLLPPTPKSSNTSEKNTSILWAWLSYWSWRSSIATTHMGERSVRRGFRLNDLSNSKEWKHQCIQGRRYPLCLFTCKIIAPSTSIIKTPVATTSLKL